MAQHDRYPADSKLRDYARGLRREAPVPERLLGGTLRGGRVAGMKFRRQHPIGPFIADFCCVRQRLVIELDGMSHEYAGTQDEQRDQAMRRMGYRVVRFSHDDVLQNFDAVVEEIWRLVGEGD